MARDEHLPIYKISYELLGEVVQVTKRDIWAATNGDVSGFVTTRAAQFCNNMNTAGYGDGCKDWHLPARQELVYMWQQSARRIRRF